MVRTDAVAAVGESYGRSSETGMTLQSTQARVCLSVASTHQLRRCLKSSAVRSTVDAVRHAVLITSAVLAARTCHVLTRTCHRRRTHHTLTRNARER